MEFLYCKNAQPTKLHDCRGHTFAQKGFGRCNRFFPNIPHVCSGHSAPDYNIAKAEIEQMNGELNDAITGCGLEITTWLLRASEAWGYGVESQQFSGDDNGSYVCIDIPGDGLPNAYSIPNRRHLANWICAGYSAPDTRPEPRRYSLEIAEKSGSVPKPIPGLLDNPIPPPPGNKAIFPQLANGNSGKPKQVVQPEAAAKSIPKEVSKAETKPTKPPQPKTPQSGRVTPKPSPNSQPSAVKKQKTDELAAAEKPKASPRDNNPPRESVRKPEANVQPKPVPARPKSTERKTMVVSPPPTDPTTPASSRRAEKKKAKRSAKRQDAASVRRTTQQLAELSTDQGPPRTSTPAPINRERSSSPPEPRHRSRSRIRQTLYDSDDEQPPELSRVRARVEAAIGHISDDDDVDEVGEAAAGNLVFK